MARFKFFTMCQNEEIWGGENIKNVSKNISQIQIKSKARESINLAVITAKIHVAQNVSDYIGWFLPM